MQRFFIFILTILCLSSCKKADPIVQPTQLEITVVDDLSNTVSGANVTLFNNEGDWAKRINAVKTVTSDTKGIALFNVEPQTYFWWAEGNCANNKSTSNTSTTSLKANTVNVVTCQLVSNGTLSLENNSTNKYKVEVNGTFIDNLLGKTVINLPNLKIGTYSVKVTQLEGFVLSATIKNYSINVSKCNTSKVAFPF